MQLPRVIIAAVFFVIGLLIAVPALVRTASSSSNASESPSSVGGSTPPATESPSASPSEGQPSRSPSKSPSPTPTPTGTPAPTPTTPRPGTPAPPLSVTIGRVDCPGRTVEVTVRNTGTTPQDYTIETDDDSPPKGDRLEAGRTRTTELPLREDRRTRVTVTWRNEPVKRATRTADCRRAAPAREELPHTGSDSGVLWTRTITGVAAMITGAIIFWYGGIWPRRRERVFPDKKNAA